MSGWQSDAARYRRRMAGEEVAPVPTYPRYKLPIWRRDGFQDLLVLILVALMALVIGIRIERIYLHAHEPAVCSSDDEVAVELTQDVYKLTAGQAGCVHIDALEVSGG